MAIINNSLNSNEYSEEVLDAPIDPALIPDEDLYLITNPTFCGVGDGLLTVVNSEVYNIWYTYSLTSLINGVETTVTGTTGTFAGLGAGFYFLTFVAKYPDALPSHTISWIKLNDSTTSSVTITVFDNKINHILVDDSGRVTMTILPSSGNTIYWYDENRDVIATGVTTLSGIDCGYFYMQVLNQNGCLSNYNATVKTVGTFSNAGMKRILYKQNQPEYKLEFDPSINYITDITYTGATVSSWKELTAFDTDSSNLIQTITLNSQSKQFTTTITLEFGEFSLYGDLYTEFIKPQNRTFSFIVQDYNDNYWYLSQVNNSRLTEMAIGQGNESVFTLTFISTQNNEMRQVNPSLVESFTITDTLSRTCTFSQAGIDSLWIAPFTGVKFPMTITNNQAFITSITGVSWSQYVVNEQAVSFGITMTKDENGQNYNMTLEAAWQYIGDSDLNDNTIDDEDSIELLINNLLYVIVKDINGLYWLFGKNSGVRLAEFEKTTGGDENGYTVGFEGTDNNIYFVNSGLI